MKLKTAILYSSVDGQTIKICNKIIDVFKQNNQNVELFSINDFNKDITHYDRLIIGASIRYGVHNKKVIDFINNNKEKIKLQDLNDFNLVTGIANANPLVKFLKSENRKFEHFSFKDHHKFSENDILQFSNHKTVITTEKDFMRLQDHISIKENLYYLPIEVSIDKPLEFNSLLENFVE